MKLITIFILLALLTSCGLPNDEEIAEYKKICELTGKQLSSYQRLTDIVFGGQTLYCADKD